MQITVGEYIEFKAKVSRTNAFFCHLASKDATLLSKLIKNKSSDSLINQRTCNWLLPIMQRNGFVKDN